MSIKLYICGVDCHKVEHASKATFRMTSNAARPLFPTLTSSNKLLLHFRFIAHSFVTSLSSYVFDMAIGGNFDAFLERLSNQRPHAPSLESDGKTSFTDVFALADAHSAMLDCILSACLLRSGQKAVGDLLREVLELVLKLSMLTGELARGMLEEYEADTLLKDMYITFQNKLSTLVSSF